MEFQLRTAYIALDNLLKTLRYAQSGAEAKRRIQSGAVTVNGTAEMRVRRKLRPGDTVEMREARIVIKGGAR
jgi:ribosome-associated protein YbcJ (S4-like RNA binding protein)